MSLAARRPGVNIDLAESLEDTVVSGTSQTTQGWKKQKQELLMPLKLNPKTKRRDWKKLFKQAQDVYKFICVAKNNS